MLFLIVDNQSLKSLQIKQNTLLKILLHCINNKKTLNKKQHKQHILADVKRV